MLLCFRSSAVALEHESLLKPRTTCATRINLILLIASPLVPPCCRCPHHSPYPPRSLTLLPPCLRLAGRGVKLETGALRSPRLGRSAWPPDRWVLGRYSFARLCHSTENLPSARSPSCRSRMTNGSADPKTSNAETIIAQLSARGSGRARRSAFAFGNRHGRTTSRCRSSGHAQSSRCCRSRAVLLIAVLCCVWIHRLGGC